MRRRCSDPSGCCAPGASSVIYISHRLKEIFEISDRVTVLRDGKHVLTQPTAEVTHEATGARHDRDGAEGTAGIGGVPGSAQSEEALRIEGAISLTVHRGEIVGLAGLAGAGRTRLLEWLFGAARSPGASEVFVGGRRVKLRTPRGRDPQRPRPGARRPEGQRPGAGRFRAAQYRTGRRANAILYPRVPRRQQAAQQWVGALRIKVAG